MKKIKDEILRIRIDGETVEKLHQVGRDLEKIRPGLDYKLSALVRAAISAWLEPPERDPREVKFRIPDSVSDAALLKFWGLAENLKAHLSEDKKTAGEAELLGVIIETMEMHFARAWAKVGKK